MSRIQNTRKVERAIFEQLSSQIRDMSSVIKAPSPKKKMAQARGTKMPPQSGRAEANKKNQDRPRELKRNQASYLKTKAKILFRYSLGRMSVR